MNEYVRIESELGQIDRRFGQIKSELAQLKRQRQEFEQEISHIRDHWEEEIREDAEDHNEEFIQVQIASGKI